MTAATPLSASYTPVLLPPDPEPHDLRTLIEPYQAMIAEQLQTVLRRTAASSTRPWLDTKINLLTGQDYPYDDPLLGRGLVSGWVQGRGLETLVGFGRWLAPYAGVPVVDDVLVGTAQAAAALLSKLREARRVNGGHVYFYMMPDGRAFVFDADGSRRTVTFTGEAAGAYNYSDLFSAKGMYTAAHYLGDGEALAEARAYCLAVYESILAGSFASDQPQPPTIASAWVPGARSHGPFMIAQGMAASFAKYESSAITMQMGLTLACHVWDTHVNVSAKWPGLLDLDLVEYVDAQGRPYLDDGKVISDPGHSLEYAGLFLNLFAALEGSGEVPAAMMAIAPRLPAFLMRNFTNGWQPSVGGICKTVDLLTRTPVDRTLPWWSLPETIRAALSCWQRAASEAERRACLQIVAQCHNAFVQNYVRPEVYLMALKVRDAHGKPLDIMPVYPDVDPGYHTTLCLMDALKIIEALPLHA